MSERIPIDPSKQNLLKHLGEPKAEVVGVGSIKDRLGRLTESPMFTSLETVAFDPIEISEAQDILGYLVDLRNASNLTKREVMLASFRTVSLFSNEDNPNERGPFIELEFSVPGGLKITKALLDQLNEFYAREVWKTEKGSSDKSPKAENEFPTFFYTRTWDYDSQDKRSISINRLKAQEEDAEDVFEILEPAKLQRRKDEKTGTVVYLGYRSKYNVGDTIRICSRGKYEYTDDASAKPGLLLYDSRPQEAERYADRPFSQLPIELSGCGKTKKIILRFDLERPKPEVREIDLYFIGVLLSDILSGRVTYAAKEGDVGSVGANYKEEISAVMAALNTSRYKNLSLDRLPGIENVAQMITEHLLEPLGKGHLDEAQDIMLVGTPGTGKTAITTAFSRINNGCALVSISAKEFLSRGRGVIEEITEFYDRYGVHTALVLQDAESLFTNAIITGSQGEGAPVDPDRRQFVLDLLSGERKTRVKFILTINKPGYIDEALRRRFLTIYVGLPKAIEYLKIGEACVSRIFPGSEYGTFRDIVSPLVANESLGYPPAFAAKLAEMLISPVSRLNGNLNNEAVLKDIVGMCSLRLKNGYPIKEIRSLDEIARKVALQIESKDSAENSSQA